ncbi:Na+/H+ antiporter subunit A [Arthrobacter sp. HMSC08H08]|uniref:Na+/H+ antiporter subunit A n=1 Tax=Arthrobacter sp. HMSC08H08 TaxID=1581143 RepID=UPI0008A1C56C|nr:Na+/H+ antiporter subunit A [Arthrobacter sp. HMSC08H08]
MLPVLLALFLAAFVAPFLVRWIGRNAFYLLALVPAAGLVWLAVVAVRGMPGKLGVLAPGTVGQDLIPQEEYTWIPTFDVEFAFRLDPLAAVLSFLILGVGALVLLYCARYFKSEDASIGPFAAQLTAFAAAMFGLVTSDDLISLFIFWEMTTILSYLLIGYARSRLSARRSALTALIVTTAGGLAMFGGLVMLGVTAGTFRLSEILMMTGDLTGPNPITPSNAVVTAAIILILVGAISKSALFPFHFWLPGAMAAPTPVSAYLHAAAMVKAGVYIVARLAPGFSDVPGWTLLTVGFGLYTLLLGGWRALRQTDIKLVLAYGTVSQLGLIIAVIGMGTPSAMLGGLALMLGHGLFKSALFLIVGAIDHGTGTRDLRNLSGLWKARPVLFVCAVISAGSMAGLPVTFGFIAKETALAALIDAPTSASTFVTLVFAIGAVITFAYAARFVWGSFATKPGVEPTPISWTLPTMAVPIAVLTLASAALGFLPGPADALLSPAANVFPEAEPHTAPLELWHGFTIELAITAGIVALGLIMFFAREPVSKLQARVPALIDGERTYRYIISGIDWTAHRVTAALQRGQLSYYLTVIIATALLVPTVGVLIGGGVSFDRGEQSTTLVFTTKLVNVLILVVMAVGAVAAMRSRRRFMGVLMVSLTGSGMVALFAFHGAPDLAVTQLLVETIVLIVFLLALRVLPASVWQARPRRRRSMQLLVAVAFGVFTAVAGGLAMAARTADPISLKYPQLAVGGGHGHNIVNVTLVDIRAWDTFGEITVLAIAATGVASLIFVVARGADRTRVGSVDTGSIGTVYASPVRQRVASVFLDDDRSGSSSAWLVAGRTLAPERRSIIIEVITRLIFHAFVLFSIYLLFAGHNSPGGGFAGGLLAGLALVLRYLAGGRVELAEAIRVGPGALLGTGLTLAVISGVVPLFFGGQIFQSAVIDFTFFGEHHFVTSTVFDIGVYLIVVGLVLDVVESLGSELDVRLDAEIHHVREAKQALVGFEGQAVRGQNMMRGGLGDGSAEGTGAGSEVTR